MNILKKLKLALLATSVMLFPKAGHTMNPEDEKPTVGSSRQFPSGPELEHPNFNSLLPASSSHPHPATQPVSLPLTGSREMNHLFGRAFLPTEKINKQLAFLRATRSPEDVKHFTDAIRIQFVEKFFPNERTTSGRIVPHFESSLQDVVSFALTLSNEDIAKRSNQLMRTMVDLDKAMPEDRRGYAFLPAFFNAPLTEEQVSRVYSQSFERLVRDIPNLVSFFTNLLDLNPNQVKNRTEAIKQYANFLLPNNEYYWYIDSVSTKENFFSTTVSLMNLGTPSIVERAKSMLKLPFEGRAEYTENNSIKEAALLLENAQLEERANTFVATLKKLPDLEPQQRLLAYLSLKLEPTVFTSFVNLTEKDNLLQILSSYHDNYVRDRLSRLDQLVSQINQDYGSVRGLASTSGSSGSMARPELEAAPQPSSSSSIHSAPTTFRTAGANPSARIKHSAVAIQLPNQDLLGDAYELVVNHRTRAEGPMVRIYDPKTKVYDNLGTLPASSSFRDTTFNITDWAKTARDTSSLGTQVETYLSFLNGKSDVHSFKIQSRGRVLKEIVFGDAVSESQAGIHVYGPEKSGDANEWSAMQSEDLSE